jgi:glycerol uptake facilitator-like aquaporin
VFTFGFAFLAPLQIFSKVSAKLNPAMCLAQWVWGNLNGIEFICLSLAEIAGAFVGKHQWMASHSE